MIDFKQLLEDTIEVSKNVHVIDFYQCDVKGKENDGLFYISIDEIDPENYFVHLGYTEIDNTELRDNLSYYALPVDKEGVYRVYIIMRHYEAETYENGQYISVPAHTEIMECKCEFLMSFEERDKQVEEYCNMDIDELFS